MNGGYPHLFLQEYHSRLFISVILQGYHSKRLSADPFPMAISASVQILREFGRISTFACGDQPPLSCKSIIPGTLSFMLHKSIILKELEMSIVPGGVGSTKGAGRASGSTPWARFFWMIDRAHC